MAASGKVIGLTVLLIVIVGAAVGIGLGLGLRSKSSGGGNAIPYVTPPVEAACPVSLKGSSNSGQGSAFNSLALDPQTIVDRFFSPGPTELFKLLADVDDRVQGINDRLGQFSGCMSSAPTAYSLGTAWATSPTFYAQCSEMWQGGAAAGFDQWGQKDETTYLYVRGGDTIVAAQLVGNGTFGNIDTVTLWYSVGVFNRNGSHAVAMVYAQPSASIFEMSVAGAGVGFCGVQMKSDGVALKVTGSEDGPGCATTDSSCTSAGDITTPVTCTPAVDSFSLPALGRKAYTTHAASDYPGGALNTVTLTDTGVDDTIFGPSVPTV